MNNSANSLLDEFHGNPPASSDAISKLKQTSRARLPEDYLRFLQKHNGGEGFIGDSYVILFCAEELPDMDEGYLVSELEPNLYLFGSNGGGEAFAFDLRSEGTSIVKVPFIPIDPKLGIPMGSSFAEFLSNL